MDRLEALLAKASGRDVEIPEEAARTEPLYGFGPEDARCVIVLEAPTYDMYEARHPFVGRIGTKILSHARRAGLNLTRWRVEYVYPFAGQIGDIHEAMESCRDRIRRATSAALIVTIGDTALCTFTGLEGSLKRRGSVYEWGNCQVLAMIDPGIIYAQKEYEKHARLDWERAKLMATPHLSHFEYCGCARRMTRTHLTPWDDTVTYAQGIIRYLAAAHDPSTVMAIDIETPRIQKKRKILCVSFAFSAHESLVLSFEHSFDTIRRLCESPCIKVGHNFVSFDRWWLHKEGIEVRGDIYDTLAMHHALDPASRQSLAFLASRYTYEPYWKDDNKEHDENIIFRTVESQKAYYEYAGLDSCVTRELYDILRCQLEQRGLVEFYHRHYTSLFDPILDLSSTGVRVSQVARQALLAECLQEAAAARDKLGAINGAPLYTIAKNATPEALAKKTVSNAQLKVLLYDKLGLPEQVKRRASGEYTATADAVTLRQLRAKYAEKRPEVAEVLDLALEHNKAHKLASFCYDSHFNEDGRFRFSLKVNTEAGRLSSSAAPDGTCSSSQNLPRDKRYRRLFLPEEGHTILDVDLSQVESRFCFMLTGDPELLRLARLRSTEFDQHKFVASLVFKKPVDAIEPKERQVSKSIGHGCFDWKTEVLTPRGFIPVVYLTQWDKVAQYNKDTKEITFCAPLEYHEYPFSGELLRFHEGFVNQTLTPNHRMLYKTNGNWKITEAQRMPKGGEVPLSGFYSGDVGVDEAVARLCAAFQADGSITAGHAIRWKFKKQRKIKRLVALLNQAGLPYQRADVDDLYIVSLHRKEAAQLLYWLPDKRFSSRLLAWSAQSLDWLIDELAYWDGSHVGGSIRYNSSDRQNVDWVQIFAHLRGFHSGVSFAASSEGSYGTEGYWRMSIGRARTSTMKHAPAPYAFEGHVYCLTVPTGFLVIRRHDRVSITGNSQRSMQGLRMSETLIKEGYTFTAEECDALIEDYHRAFPAIRQWHQQVRKEVRAAKRLVNSWGRVWDVRYEEVNDELFRRGYSWVLQSLCADLMNQQGFIPLWHMLKDGKMRSRILLHTHDGLVVSCPTEEIYQVAHFLQTSLEAPRSYNGVELSIPVEMKIGKTWVGEVDFPILPDYETFMDTVRSL